MAKSLQDVLNNADSVYSDVIKIADDISHSITYDIDNCISEIVKKANTLTNEEVRQAIIDISLKSYSFSEYKEKAAFKADIAKTLKDEEYARHFISAEGAVKAKELAAELETSSESLCEKIYDLVAAQLKTKLDESHRVVDTLKSVLVSRMSEAKLTQFINDSQPIE